MTTKYTKHKLASYLALIVIMASFFATPITALAATVNYTRITDYVSTWYLANPTGHHWTDDGVHMIKSEDEPTFCIEHGIILKAILVLIHQNLQLLKKTTCPSLPIMAIRRILQMKTIGSLKI